MPPFPSNEYQLIASLGKILGRSTDARYPLTIGDDAAIRTVGNDRMVITADISVENVHFTLDTASLREIGYKAMVSNVSDCAAMGAAPEAAIIQLVFPKGGVKTGKGAINCAPTSINNAIAEIYRGFAQACRKWNFKIIGGDLSGGPCWTIGITLLGKIPKGNRPLLRKGIKSGDTLWISGFPGGTAAGGTAAGRSASGLAAIQRFGRKEAQSRFPSLVRCHIKPEPRVGLGLLLGRMSSVHAAMDLSDGISKDAGTLCHDNKLGLELSFDKLKPSRAMLELSRSLNIPWQRWALHGGEEYELIFATGKGFDTSSVIKKGFSIFPIGNFTDAHGQLLLRDRDRMIPVRSHSFDHLS